MKLRIVHSRDLNKEKWDTLVSETNSASLFSHSWFLEGIAENWYALVDKDYTFGVALPYTIRARQEILYTPIFVSYLDVLGDENVDFENVKKLILDKFKIIEIEFSKKILDEPSQIFVCQQISDQYILGSQAKRGVNKAKKSGCKTVETRDFGRIFQLIRNELTDRYIGVTEISLNKLENAYSLASQANSILCFEVWLEDEFLGGVVCLENSNQVLFSKGTVTEKGKELGAMYFVMSEIIESTLQNGKRFDFGGSRIEGVQRFNHNLGGKDIEFYSYRNDAGPIWFKFIRKLYFKWIKR